MVLCWAQESFDFWTMWAQIDVIFSGIRNHMPFGLEQQFKARFPHLNWAAQPRKFGAWSCMCCVHWIIARYSCRYIYLYAHVQMYTYTPLHIYIHISGQIYQRYDRRMLQLLALLSEKKNTLGETTSCDMVPARPWLQSEPKLSFLIIANPPPMCLL